MTNIWKHATKYTWFALVSLLIINSVGLFAMRWVGNQADAFERQKYIETAELASISISADQIQQLTNSPREASTPTYRAIKDLLVRSQNIHPASYLSLLGKAGDQIVVLVSSSTNTSRSKYAHGEASPGLSSVFANGRPGIDNKPGWVSALVPIWDSKTEQVVAVLELDIPDGEWRKHLTFAQLIPFLTALFLSILVILPIPLHQRSELIQQELRKLSRAVEYSPVSIIITDDNANIQYVNPKFNEVTGYSSDEVIGKNPRILGSGDTPGETYAALWQSITSGGVWTGMFHNKKKNGETYWESATIAPIMDEFGKTTHYLGVKEDITRRIEAEQALKDQTLKAEIDNLAKGEFLANMSHELRTPMNGVVSMTRLLLQTDLTSEQRQYAEIIYSSGEALLPLIQDILDFSKIEANRVELEDVNFDLTEMIEETINLFSLDAQEKGLRLDLKISPTVPRLVRGDPERLRRVIINLIGNAIKFTSYGEVSITVEQQSENEEDSVLRVSVRDTGIGIPQDRIPHLFNPFIQGNTAINREYGGTGLGLAISRQLVELMSGRLYVESQEGKGSTFWFTTVVKKQNLSTQSTDNQNVTLSSRSRDRMKPLTINQQVTSSVSQRINEKKQVRILLAEDNPINQKVGELTLQKLGYFVDLAANGLEAIQALRQNQYDLVLMDCHMPEMDGFTASTVIRASDPAMLNTQVPIIAMTARTLDEDRELCLAAGMNDYLSKPVHPGELLTKLEYWIHNSTNERGKQPEKPGGQKAQPSPDEKQEDPMSAQVIIFNESELLKRLMGDRELAKTILAAFIQETPKQIAALKQEITNRDAVNARLHAHSIRGASANMGAESLREAAHQAEILGLKNDLDGMEVFFPNIERAFEQFEQTIQKRNDLLTLEGLKQ